MERRKKKPKKDHASDSESSDEEVIDEKKSFLATQIIKFVKIAVGIAALGIAFLYFYQDYLLYHPNIDVHWPHKNYKGY